MYGTNALLKRTVLCVVVVLVGLVVMCNDVVLSPAVIAYLPVTECISDWEIFLVKNVLRLKKIVSDSTSLLATVTASLILQNNTVLYVPFFSFCFISQYLFSLQFSTCNSLGMDWCLRGYISKCNTCLTNRFTSLVCIQDRKMLSGDWWNHQGKGCQTFLPSESFS